MFNIGGMELIVILLVALIVLGPDKLPEAARKAGQMMNDLRKMSAGFKKEIQSAIDEGTSMVDPLKSATGMMSSDPKAVKPPSAAKQLTSPPENARPIIETPAAESGNGNGSAASDATPTDATPTDSDAGDEPGQS